MTSEIIDVHQFNEQYVRVIKTADFIRLVPQPEFVDEDGKNLLPNTPEAVEHRISIPVTQLSGHERD